MIVGLPMRKQPAEIWDWGVDFQDVLSEQQSIASGMFRAIRESDLVDVTADLQQGSPLITGTILSQLIKAGVIGQTYMLELTMTDSTSRIFEAERRLIVLGIP